MHPMWTYQGVRGDGAETGVMCLQAKECHKLPATQEARREAWDRFSPKAFRESVALLIQESPSFQKFALHHFSFMKNLH